MSLSFHTVYKTTNKRNGKYYIGKHQTNDLNDGYMGSGKLITAAIKKYGIDNFVKEILRVFDNEEEMNEKEKELVVISENTYNLCEGGNGGFGYINSQGLNTKGVKLGYLAAKEKLILYNSTKKLSNDHSAKLRKAIKEKYPNGIWFEKSHSKETKLKIGKANKGRVPWNKGKKWIAPGRFI